MCNGEVLVQMFPVGHIKNRPTHQELRDTVQAPALHIRKKRAVAELHLVGLDDTHGNSLPLALLHSRMCSPQWNKQAPLGLVVTRASNANAPALGAQNRFDFAHCSPVYVSKLHLKKRRIPSSSFTSGS